MFPTSLLAPATTINVAPKTESVASIAYVLERHFIVQIVKYSYAAELAGTLGTLYVSCRVRRRCGKWPRSLKVMNEGVRPLFYCCHVERIN